MRPLPSTYDFERRRSKWRSEYLDTRSETLKVLPMETTAAPANQTGLETFDGATVCVMTDIQSMKRHLGIRSWRYSDGFPKRTTSLDDSDETVVPSGGESIRLNVKLSLGGSSSERDWSFDFVLTLTQLHTVSLFPELCAKRLPLKLDLEFPSRP